MFTFGIFSTNLPYLIMVLFYAVYFLFGNHKAVSDIDLEVNIKNIEEQTISIVNLQNSENDYSFDCSSGTMQISRCYAFKLLPLKIALFDTEYLFESRILSYNRFSRPPPFC